MYIHCPLCEEELIFKEHRNEITANCIRGHYQYYFCYDYAWEQGFYKNYYISNYSNKLSGISLVGAEHNIILNSRKEYPYISFLKLESIINQYEILL